MHKGPLEWDFHNRARHIDGLLALAYLQSQKTLLVPAAHGPLTCLQDIDGVYMGQDVLEVELQVRPDGLHHLY